MEPQLSGISLLSSKPNTLISHRPLGAEEKGLQGPCCPLLLLIPAPSSLAGLPSDGSTIPAVKEETFCEERLGKPKGTLQGKGWPAGLVGPPGSQTLLCFALPLSPWMCHPQGQGALCLPSEQGRTCGLYTGCGALCGLCIPLGCPGSAIPALLVPPHLRSPPRPGPCRHRLSQLL